MLKVVGAVLALMGTAYAADLPVKAPVTTVTANPSGFYFGINAIGEFDKNNIDWTALSSVLQGETVDSPGLGTGISLGYRLWMQSGMWIAPELSIDYLFARDGTGCLVVDRCDTKSSWTGSGVIKLGVPIGVLTGTKATLVSANLPVVNELPTSAWATATSFYVAGGARVRQLNGCVVGVADPGCQNQTLWGWTAGGGLLVPISTSVNLDLSVMYDGFDKSFNNPATPTMFSGTWKSSNGVTAQLSLDMGF